MQEKFELYLKRYDLTNKDILRKYHHSYRVATNCQTIASSLNLTSSECELMYNIGLLHDVGRFYQFSNYGSNNDKFYDHGDGGAKLLFEYGEISNFDIEPSNYIYIKTAIRNHNKYQIESNISDKERLYSEILRDADKLDLIWLTTGSFIDDISHFHENYEGIKEEYMRDFYNCKLVKYIDEVTVEEQILIILSFVFDLKFNSTLKKIKEDKMLEKISDKLINQRLKEASLISINYLNNRLDDKIC